MPQGIKEDRIWRVTAYRLALYLADMAVIDTAALVADPRFAGKVPQLCDAAGSVAANIAEGYPRRSSKDRVKFYDYALTSLAETKSWYIQIRSALDGKVMDERLATMLSISRLVHTMMRSARKYGQILPPPASDEKESDSPPRRSA
ncbi:MAG: four helix bundle protein [Gemmatimonadaceae bacterium]|nr:four helix bundle protein [Gemmatimonadaceae bacterium]